MADEFASHTNSPISPARRAWHPVQSDTVALDRTPKALRFDAAGTVVYRATNSDTDVTINALAGETLAVHVAFIRDTGTSLTNAQITAYA